MDGDRNIEFLKNNKHYRESSKLFNEFAEEHNMSYAELQIKETCYKLNHGCLPRKKRG